MEKFDWQEFYEELADRLRAYREDHAMLLQKIIRAHERAGVNFPRNGKSWDVNDIDPFSVFALLNRRITEDKKIALLSEVKKEFNLYAKVPDCFSGIPLADNRKAFLFPGGAKASQYVHGLWRMFEVAMDYAAGKCSREAFCNQYSHTEKQPIVRINLTMGLFWIRPEFYINLDGCNMEFIFESGTFASDFIERYSHIEKEFADGTIYLDFCDDIKKEISGRVSHFASIPHLSSKAYEWRKEHEERRTHKRKVHFYKLGCHPDDVRLDLSFEWCRDGEIAVGWNDLGDIDKRFRDKVGHYDEQKIAKALDAKSSAAGTRTAREIIRFMEAGANVVFVVMRGESLIGLVDEVGPYQFKKERDNADRFAQCRSGVWHKCFEEGERLPFSGEGLRRTCVEIKNAKNVEFLLKRYRMCSSKSSGSTRFVSQKVNHAVNVESLKKRLEKMSETERRSESMQRLGQSDLRKYLLASGGGCAITNIRVPELLVASHIKGWQDSSIREQVDTENVLLLAKNYDAAFDKHLISFDASSGKIIKAARIDWKDLLLMGIQKDAVLPKPSKAQARYLRYHFSVMRDKDRKYNCGIARDH